MNYYYNNESVSLKFPNPEQKKKKIVQTIIMLINILQKV